MDNARNELQEVFRSVFDDPGLTLRDDTAAHDIEGWDSLAHINLIIAIERAFGIKFATAEMSRMKEPGQNIGTMVSLIVGKTAATPV